MKRRPSVVSVAFLAVILLLMLAEDLGLWVERGVVPGAEFLALGVATLIVLYLGFRSMAAHRP